MFPTRPYVNELRQDLEASRLVPILTLVLLLTRQARLRGTEVPHGAAVLLEGWAGLATELLATIDADPAAVQLARKVGLRAMRIAQGYDSAARDKAYHVMVEYLEGSRGVARPLTDEEEVVINTGLLHAFTSYAAFLDHTAGAVAGGA
jgi:hypothetical protein